MTGSPDASAVKYARITITYSEAITDTDFRLDDLRVGQSVKMELEYFSEAFVETTGGSIQLEFNPDAVTQTDLLRGARDARKAIVEGTVYELFRIIGGKAERDRTDALRSYEKQRHYLSPVTTMSHQSLKEGREIERRTTCNSEL